MGGGQATAVCTVGVEVGITVGICQPGHSLADRSGRKPCADASFVVHDWPTVVQAGVDQEPALGLAHPAEFMSAATGPRG